MSAHVAQSYQIKIARASCRIRYPCFAAIVTHLHTPRCRPLVRCSAAAPCVDVTSYQWTGRDEFTDLDDRKELDPLPLPTISTHKRIVLVRHGQSTWNAEGRIQGSTDFAVLTKKGQDQAATTHEMVCACHESPTCSIVSGRCHAVRDRRMMHKPSALPHMSHVRSVCSRALRHAAAAGQHPASP